MVDVIERANCLFLDLVIVPSPPNCIRREGIVVSACVAVSAFFNGHYQCHITCQCVGSYTLTVHPIILHVNLE